MDNRVSWDEYFMNVARASRHAHLRPQARGSGPAAQDHPVHQYNGSIRASALHRGGHMMEDGHCVATVHAEANAIIQAAKNGVAIEGASIYTTASLCWPCFKLIANAGRRRTFGEFYRDERISSTRSGSASSSSSQGAGEPDVQPADTGHREDGHRARAAPAGARACGRGGRDEFAGVSVLRSSSPTTAATAARRDEELLARGVAPTRRPDRRGADRGTGEPARTCASARSTATTRIAGRRPGSLRGRSRPCRSRSREARSRARYLHAA